MNTHTQEAFDAILDKHEMWWYRKPGGEQAILKGAVLRGLKAPDRCFIHADLENADLRGADLRSADMRTAVLIGANLKGARMQGVNLVGAFMYRANLEGADLAPHALFGAHGPPGYITLCLPKHTVTIHQGKATIWGERRTAEGWAALPDSYFGKIHLNAREWWHRWRPLILSAMAIANSTEV